METFNPSAMAMKEHSQVQFLSIETLAQNCMKLIVFPIIFQLFFVNLVTFIFCCY